MLALFSRGPWPYAILIVLSLVAFLPGIADVPPLDRDEPRFAQASRQMLETGDFIDIRFQEDPRHKKPIGIYWLQSLSVAVTTGEQVTTLWPWRLVSVFGAIIAVLGTCAVATRLAGSAAGLAAGAVMAISVLLSAEAHIAKTDATLLATIVAAQAALAAIYLPWARARRGAPTRAAPTPAAAAERVAPAEPVSPEAFAAADPPRPPAAPAAPEAASPPEDDRPGSRAARITFWLALGIGILIKGPIAPMVVGLTILALLILHGRAGWLKQLGWLWGVPLMLAVAAPWLIAITLATDGEFLQASVGVDLWPKIISAQESHGAPPGTYMALAILTLFPGSLFLLPALIAAVGRWREPMVRFCLAWIVPTWLVMELVPTKLVHYVMPTYPALAVLIGALLAGPLADRLPALIRSRWMWLWYGLWGLLGLTLAVGVVVIPFYFGTGFEPWSLAAAGSVSAGVLGALWLLRRGRAKRGLAAALVGATLAYGFTMAFVAPSLDRLWLSRSLADAVAAAEIGGDAPVASAGFSEPSLVFYLGTDTLLTDGAGAAAHLLAHPEALALVEAGEQAAFEVGLAEHGLAVEALSSVDGMNYSRGDWLTLTVYRLVPQ